MKKFLETSTITKLISSIAPAIVLLFSLLIFGSSELFISNSDEFWFELKDIMPSMLIVFIAGVIIISSFLFVLPKRITLYLKGLIYAVAIALYLQGNFLPNDYGTLNGQEIIWSNYQIRAIYNTLIWVLVILAVLFLCYKYKEKTTKMLMYIGIAIILIQSISLITILLLSNKSDNNSKSYLSKEGEFTVSSKENTIVLLFDCFDAEVLKDLINDYPEVVNETFADFTFYRNTIGGATRTKYALPYMFIGKTNTEEISYVDYINNEYNNSPLFKELNTKKYDSRIYSFSTFIDTNQLDAIENIETGKPKITNNFSLAKKFGKLVLFKYSPHILKKNFWLYSGDFDTFKSTDSETDAYSFDDVLYYNELKNGLTISTNKPCFRFYHLNGDHGPFLMNSKAERVNNGESDEKEQALGCLTIAKEYINQLKNLGLYDEAHIIVMSDHGSSRGVEQNPIFLVKESNTKKDFSISEIPLSYATFADYLSSVLNNRNTKIDDYSTDGIRYFYVNQDEMSLVNIIEYACDPGVMAWDHAKIYKTGTIYHQDSLNVSYDYTLGTKLFFSIEATANKYEKLGFSKNEGHYTWTDGEESKMLFEIKDKNFDNLELLMTYYPFTKVQNVVVYANDNIVADYIASKKEEKKIIIPKEYVQDNILELKFEFPGAITPFEYTGANDGTRLLSFQMYDITISNTEEEFVPKNQINSYEYELGENIDFDNIENSKYIKAGFEELNELGLVSFCKTGKLYFDFKNQNINNDLLLKFSHGIFGESKDITIKANGETVAEYSATSDTEMEIIIPKDYIKDNTLLLTFELPDAQRGRELGFDIDRLLSIKPNYLIIEEITN